MNKNEVLEKLKSVIYPGFEKSIVDFGFVQNVEVGDRIFVVKIKQNFGEDGK